MTTPTPAELRHILQSHAFMRTLAFSKELGVPNSSLRSFTNGARKTLLKKHFDKIANKVYKLHQVLIEKNNEL